MTNQEDISHYMGLAKDTLLATCAKVRKNLQDLFPEIMILLLVLRKKNFTQMAKYGKHNEHTYRSAFRKGQNLATEEMEQRSSGVWGLRRVGPKLTRSMLG